MTFYEIPTVQDSIISVYYILSNGKLQMIGDVAHDYLRDLQKAKQLQKMVKFLISFTCTKANYAAIEEILGTGNPEKICISTLTNR